MEAGKRLEELKAIFEKVDQDKSKVIAPILEEVVFMETRLKELRALPQIRVHRKDPQRQEATPASKQYKETMQAYLNAVKVLQMTLSRNTQEEVDAFDAWLNSREE